jgi:hypothetical protein
LFPLCNMVENILHGLSSSDFSTLTLHQSPLFLSLLAPLPDLRSSSTPHWAPSQGSLHRCSLFQLLA